MQISQPTEMIEFLWETLLDHLAPIMWKISKQKSVYLFTKEAEFISMTHPVKELLWFDHILEECFSRKILNVIKPTAELFVDNLATTDFVKSPIENEHTKHIGVKLFLLETINIKISLL